LEKNVDEKGKNERNLRLFERQVRAYPDHAYSWYKYGDFLRRFPTRRDDAIAALDRARELIAKMDPKDARDLSFGAEVFALLALDADKRKDYAAALRLLEAGRDRFDETPNMLHVLGHVLARSGDHRGSLRAYARLRQADRRLHAIPPEPGITGPYAYFAMGRALVHLGFPKAAMRCLDESVKLDGAALDPRSLRARLRLDRGDLDGAIADYRTALEHHPNDLATHTRLAHVSFAAGDAQSAAREFELAIEHGADVRSFAAALGQAYLVAGRFEKALDTFASNSLDENCSLGLRLLELIAAGRDPSADATFQSPAGRSWLRALLPAKTRTVEGPQPVATGSRCLESTVDAPNHDQEALFS
jgi:tetratricopeptide (TPR) repeat protein